ncbi:MAG: thioredoxin family protein [Candidatus Heimdallarchaeaceae archaeon]
MSLKKKIEVLGSNCKKCKQQLAFVKEALAELGKEDLYEVEYITDVDTIVNLGIFITPALRINGKKISEGRIMGKAKLKKIL